MLLPRSALPVAALALALAGASPACKCGGSNLRQQAPQIEVSPAALGVMPLPVGKSSLHIVQVRNAGNADLHFQADPTVAETDNDGNAGELLLPSILTHDCAGARRSATSRMLLGPGECARVVVQYAPANVGQDSGELKIASDDPDRPVVTVPISMGEAPKLSLCALDESGNVAACDAANGTPPTVAFGHAAKDTTLQRKLRLKNEGKSTLDIAAILDPDGPMRIEFSRDISAVPSKLAAGATAEVLVKFRPAAGGTRSAWLQIESADPLRPSVQVPLRGQGDGPALCADPSPLEFGQNNIGATSEKTVTLSSCGTAPVQLGKVALDPLSSVAFGTGPLPAPQTMAVGATIDVKVRFRPDSAGETSGALLTPTPEVPDAYVLLRGSGIDAPVCRLEPSVTKLSFGQVVRGGTADRSLTLANRGKLDCHLNSFSITQGSTYFKVLNAPTSPVPMRPGDAFTLQLRYAPPANDANTVDTGVGTADSDDPARPKLDIQLEGTPVASPVCKLRITPAGGSFFAGRLLQFGNVVVNRDKTLPITFTNIGSAACTIGPGKFVNSDFTSPCGTSSCGEFSIVPPAVQQPIQPGAQSQINVKFAPRGTNQTGSFPTIYLNVRTGDAAIASECIQGFPPDMTNGCIEVGMAGQGVISHLAVLPSDLDFGLVTLGCRSRTENITLYNTGTATFTIKSFKVEPAGQTSFYIVAPPTPFQMAGGARVQIQVTYKPSQVGLETATLYIESDASNTGGGNPYVTVGLSGTGTTDKHQKDTFNQLSKPTVDMLFVVDNSGSFGTFQQKLSDQAPRFIQKALTYNASYQIGVIGNYPDGTSRADSAASYPGTTIYPGGLYGRPGIVTNSTPNATDAFSKNVKVGTEGSDSRESGLESAWLALTPPVDTKPPPEGSQGFLREEARLVVVNVADEVDQSRGTTDFYADFFQQLKGRYNAGLVSFNSIMGPPSSSSETCDGAAKGDRYYDVVKKTGGKWWNLCTADWSVVADDLALDAFAGRVQFPLSREADPATVVVTMNATPQNNPADYTFDQASNSVIFKTSPPPGAVIVVEYDAICR